MPLGQPQVYQVPDELSIPFDYYEHPPAPAIEAAQLYRTDREATYCKNLFFRNHKGNRHYLADWTGNRYECIPLCGYGE